MTAAMPPAERDFPYYAGTPVALRGGQWLIVLAGVALGTAALLTVGAHLPAPWSMIVPPVIFVGVMLGGLALATGRAWTAPFMRIRASDVVWMFAIAGLNIVLSVALALLLSNYHSMSANPMGEALATGDSAQQALQFVMMAPQLLGEELMTILPFLACLWWLHHTLRLTRRSAIIGAWLLSAIPFALVHLPTYQWDLLQCLVIIGGARLVLTLAYLKTKNLWTCTGAHVLNDWILFAVPLALG